MQSNKDNWINSQMLEYSNAKRDIIAFIAGIRYKSNIEEDVSIIIDLFRNGYCYYFAVLLYTAFGRGTICYVYDEGHIVWVDGDNDILSKCTAYDINGVYAEYRADYFIPMDIFEEGIIDFLHVPTLTFSARGEFMKRRAEVWLNNPKVRERYNNHNQFNRIKRYIEQYKSALGLPYYSVERPDRWLEEKYIEDFSGAYMKEFPKANKYILQFIEDMIFKTGIEGAGYIITLFCKGYCYYFAKILKEAFPNGTIWFSPENTHIVFVDGENPINSFYYDARGVVTDISAGELCPIEIFGELIINYMHLPYIPPESHGIAINEIASAWRGEKSNVSKLLNKAEGN